MALKLYPEEDIQSIASAIRNKTGSSSTYTVVQLASAILNIGSENIIPFLEGTLTTYYSPLVTTVGSYAFRNFTTLSLVSLPNAATISNYAFSGCTNLSDLYLMGSLMCTLGGRYAFSGTKLSGTTATGCIHVPTSLAASYKAATNWTYYSSRINIDA